MSKRATGTYVQLQGQIDELRTALDRLKVNSHEHGEQVADKLANISEQLADVQSTLNAIHQKLNGQDDVDVRDVVDKLVLAVENMGRLFETLHREGALKNEVLDSLVSKLSADNIWRGAAEIFQSLLIAQYAAENQ